MSEMSWDEAEKVAKSSGGGKYVRLPNDKDKVVLALIGNPHVKMLYWNEGKSEPFTDAHKAKGLQPKASFRFNAYCPVTTIGDKKQLVVQPITGVMKIYECSTATFMDVVKVKDKYGLDKVFVEIERHGTKLDTTYSILPDAPITPDHAKWMAELEKHNLSEADDDFATDMNSHEKGAASTAAPANGHTNGTHAAPPAAPAVPLAQPSPNDALIDQATAAQVIARVKPLNEEKRKEFLAAIRVPQIKMLKGSQLPDVIRLLDKLEGKVAPQAIANSAPTEIDPFG